jgi:hypothetical protein
MLPVEGRFAESERSPRGSAGDRSREHSLSTRPALGPWLIYRSESPCRRVVLGSDRALLFPLVLSSPIYTLQDIYTLFAGFQWSTAQMFDEFMAYDAASSAPVRGAVPPLSGRDRYADRPCHRVLCRGGGRPKELALIKDAGHNSRHLPNRIYSPPNCAPGYAPSCARPPTLVTLRVGR